MNPPRIAYLVAALLLVAPTRLLAQRQPPVEPGDRVRVWAPSVGIEGSVGTVLALKPDTVVVDNGEPLALAIGSLTRLDVSRDRKSRTGTGGTVGFFAGAFTGAVIGFASTDPGKELSAETDFNETLETVAIAAVLGGLVGYGAGALIGSTIKVDHWETVSLARLRVTLTPQGRDRLTVSMSLRL